MSETQPSPAQPMGATPPARTLLATLGDAQVLIEGNKLLIWRNGATFGATPRDWIEWAKQCSPDGWGPRA